MLTVTGMAQNCVMTERIGRARALAYRIAAHGLDRRTRDATRLNVLDLGVQETRGSALSALAVRLPEPPAAGLLAEGGPLVLLWSVRGAPHIHRRADLPALATALWPRDDTDAMTRLSSERAALKAAGIAGLAAYTAATRAMREVVTGPLTKGEVSAAMTEALPKAYSYACRSCGTVHVSGGIFQLVGLPAGVYHREPSPKLVLAPLPDRPEIPAKSLGTDGFLRGYLRLHGPATLAEAAGYLDTSQAAARPVWPAGLVEVDLDGRRTWLPEEDLDALRTAPDPDYVRLLPPLDPYLQARDRDLTVPDTARQKEIWRVLGNPGAVLANGEVVAVWRARTAGRKGLDVGVRAFDRLPAGVGKAIEAEAVRLAGLRGLTDVRVSTAG